MSGAREQSSAAVKYRLLRELGQRSQRTYAALREDGTNAVLVVQRFARNARVEEERVSPEAMTALVRDARCLVKNWHPNIAHVRHVDLIGGTIYIATDLLDGITLEDLLLLVKTTGAGRVEGSILARIFLDVLSGLQALHGLRDGVNTPLNAVHGELCPANVVIGRDGVARIVSVFRPRPVKISARSEALCYAAPETLAYLLAREIEQDARIDLWAVGIMLWEALRGQRLYRDTDPTRIAQRQREEEVASPPGPLADIAMKAIAFDPLLRFRSASDMAASIRALDTEVASGAALAQIVVELAGERIRTRRSELHPGASGERPAVQRDVQPVPKATPSGLRPRVSVATSTAVLPANSVPQSSGTTRDALMTFEKRAPILEGAPDSADRRGRTPKLTPPPGRIRRLSSQKLQIPSRVGAPAPSASPPKSVSEPDVEIAYTAIPSGARESGFASEPVIAHAVSSIPPQPSSERAPSSSPALLETQETRRVLPASSSQALDENALSAARDVLVSTQSTTTPPGAPGSMLLPRVAPPPSKGSAQPPPPSFASIGHLTAPLAPFAPPGASLTISTPPPYADRPPVSSDRPVFVRAPPRDDLREEVTAKRRRVGFARQAVPLLIAGMAVLAISILLAGAAIIARRGGATIGTSPPPTTTTVEPPSTIVVAPAPQPSPGNVPPDTRDTTTTPATTSGGPRL